MCFLHYYFSQTSKDFVFSFDGEEVFRSSLKKAYRLSECTIVNLKVNGMCVSFERGIRGVSLANHCILHVGGNVNSSLNVASGSVFSSHSSVVQTNTGNITQVPSQASPKQSNDSGVDILDFIFVPQIIVGCDVLIADCVASRIRVLGSICDVSADHALVSVFGSSSIIETEDAYVMLNSASTLRSVSGHIVFNHARSAYSEFGIVNVDKVDIEVTASERKRRKKMASMLTRNGGHSARASVDSSGSADVIDLSDSSSVIDVTDLSKQSKPSSHNVSSTLFDPHHCIRPRFLPYEVATAPFSCIRAFSIYNIQASKYFLNSLRRFIKSACWGNIHGTQGVLMDLFQSLGEYLHIEYDAGDDSAFFKEMRHVKLLHSHRHGDPNYNTCIVQKHTLSTPPHVFESNFKLGGMHYLHKGLHQPMTCDVFQGFFE